MTRSTHTKRHSATTRLKKRTAIAVTVELFCRDKTMTLTLRNGEPGNGYRPVGKKWRTLRRGDLVRGPEGYEYTVRRLTLEEAEPPLPAPLEIESVAAWATMGLGR